MIRFSRRKPTVLTVLASLNSPVIGLCRFNHDLQRPTSPSVPVDLQEIMPCAGHRARFFSTKYYGIYVFFVFLLKPAFFSFRDMY